MTIYVFLLSYIPVLSGGCWYVTEWACSLSTNAAGLDHLFFFPVFRPMHKDAQIHRGILRHEQSNFYFHSFHYSVCLNKFLPDQRAESGSSLRDLNRLREALCNSLNYITKSTYLRSLFPYSWVMMAPVKLLDLSLNDTLYCFHLAPSKKEYQNFGKGKCCVWSPLGKFVFVMLLSAIYPHI